MPLSRRSFLNCSAAIGSLFTFEVMRSAFALAESSKERDVKTGANGLYVQPWFEDSFLDLKEDLAEATTAGKQLAVIYEQAGCPYCKELHKVILMKPSIASFMQQHFRVVQIDIRGSREVTDFQGTVLSERDFSHQMQIHFTPSISFFPLDPALVLGKTGRQSEAFRLTGFWKAFHFETVLHFVQSGSYKTQNLQKFLASRLKRFKKNGQAPMIWD